MRRKVVKNRSAQVKSLADSVAALVLILVCSILEITVAGIICDALYKCEKKPERGSIFFL